MLRQGMAYLNAYDQDLNFACPKETQSVSHVESIHDNHKGDRMFDISCSDVTNDVSGVSASCFVQFLSQHNITLQRFKITEG
jgi:hypothetical protein